MDPDISKKGFARRLEFVLKRSGYDRESLAKALDKSHSTVGKWCNGDNFPTLETFLQISNLVGVSPEYLLTGRSVAQNGKTDERRMESLEKLVEQLERHIQRLERENERLTQEVNRLSTLI